MKLIKSDLNLISNLQKVSDAFNDCSVRAYDGALQGSVFADRADLPIRTCPCGLLAFGVSADENANFLFRQAEESVLFARKSEDIAGWKTSCTGKEKIKITAGEAFLRQYTIYCGYKAQRDIFYKNFIISLFNIHCILKNSVISSKQL